MSSYQEILSQIEELKRKAEGVRQQEMSGAIAEIKRLMAQFGITTDDLGVSSSANRHWQIKTARYGGGKIPRSAQRQDLDWSRTPPGLGGST
jgi:DNA-binding protein H-NS